jgi:hypothetical protein
MTMKIVLAAASFRAQTLVAAYQRKCALRIGIQLASTTIEEEFDPRAYASKTPFQNSIE